MHGKAEISFFSKKNSNQSHYKKCFEKNLAGFPFGSKKEIRFLPTKRKKKRNRVKRNRRFRSPFSRLLRGSKEGREFIFPSPDRLLERFFFLCCARVAGGWRLGFGEALSATPCSRNWNLGPLAEFSGRGWPAPAPEPPRRFRPLPKRSEPHFPISILFRSLDWS